MGQIGISLILGILEVMVAPLPLSFLWVVCFAMVGGDKESFLLSFLSGFWLDFLKGDFLGKTSLVFLGFSVAVFLYKRKFKVLHPLYFFPFVLVAVLFYDFWESGVIGEIGKVGVLRMIWSLVVAVGLFKLAQGFRPKEKGIKL